MVSKYFLILSIHLSVVSLSKNEKLPLVITTWAFTNATQEAWNVLNQEKSTRIDAIVAGCSRCETEQCDHTVGYGGSPDENGETTLDSMIFDGETMDMGAVANLRNIKNAVGVARHVFEHTEHSILAGNQATNFAKQMGFEEESLVTPKSKEMWKDWRSKNCQPNFWKNVIPNPNKVCGPYQPVCTGKKECPSKSNEHNFGRWNHDTISMIVVDKMGKITVGTSSNGATHKVPGRVGDAPIPGAGAYATNIGGAAATGDGDAMMRFLPSFAAVESLRNGLKPQEAATDAINRILKYYPLFSGAIIVASNTGDYAAACANIKEFPYSVVHGSVEQKVTVENIKCLGNNQ